MVINSGNPAPGKRIPLFQGLLDTESKLSLILLYRNVLSANICGTGKFYMIHASKDTALYFYVTYA